MKEKFTIRHDPDNEEIVIEMGTKKMYITPDDIRDPQIAKLEQEIRRAKWMRWVFLAVGLVGGVLISLLISLFI
ncbi:unnamed protein product [marine sediment metagenome]|uniref:Uncharacterized protein n=1 Tax=marine sediment metagenome TaxID=412755 RepID=X1FGW1_9ZZZZ